MTAEVVALEKAERVSLIMVATRRGEGEATAWFDDPSIVEVGSDGQEKTLLPWPRKVPPAVARQVAAELAPLSDQLGELAGLAKQGADPKTLAAQVLSRVSEIEQKAESIRKTTAEYANLAAALTTAAKRLRRAAALLGAAGVSPVRGSGHGQDARGTRKTHPGNSSAI